MSLYVNEINRQLSGAKYRSLKHEADAERALNAASNAHADRKRSIRAWVSRLAAMIGNRLSVRTKSSRGETPWTRTVCRPSEHRQFPVS